MHRMKRYGITPEDYGRHFEEQGGKCAICQLELIRDGKNAHIDHCHRSGKVRGLLCYQCNVGIGNFKDNVELLKAAIAYLQDRVQ